MRIKWDNLWQVLWHLANNKDCCFLNYHPFALNNFGFFSLWVRLSYICLCESQWSPFCDCLRTSWDWLLLSSPSTLKVWCKEMIPLVPRFAGTFLFHLQVRGCSGELSAREFLPLPALRNCQGFTMPSMGQTRTGHSWFCRCSNTGIEE